MVDFKKLNSDKKNGKTEVNTKVPKYLQRLQKLQEAKEAKESGEKKKRPRAYYQKLPFFTVPVGKTLLYFGEFTEVPFEDQIEDPTWCENNEQYAHLRIHFMDKGLKGKAGYPERYVVCPKSLDRQARCAFCEAYRALWAVKISKFEDDDPEKQQWSTIAGKFRPTQQKLFPMLNLTLLDTEPPDCFTVEGQLDIESKKCQECPFQDHCYRGGLKTELFAMTPSTKDKFDESLNTLYTENEEYTTDHTNVENGVVFELSCKMKKKGKDRIEREINFRVVEFDTALKPEYVELFQSTLPSIEDLQKAYAETHSYKQMLVGLSKDVRECLEAWFDEVGLEYPVEPEAEEKPQRRVSGTSNGKGSSKVKTKRQEPEEDEEESDEEDSDDENEEESDSDDSEEESEDEEDEQEVKAPVSSKSKVPEFEYKDNGLVSCFADTDIYNTEEKRCYLYCQQYEQCSGVIDGKITEKQALKALGLVQVDKSKTEKPAVKTKLGKMLK